MKSRSAKLAAGLLLVSLSVIGCTVGVGTATPTPAGGPAPTPTATATPTPAATPTPSPTPSPTPTPVPRPVGSFLMDVSSGTVPLNVQFGDTSQGAITTWQWDFGDGSSSTAQHPSHEYTAAGSHTVRLTVSGPGGSHTVALPEPIAITPGALADVVVSPGLVSLQVQETARLRAAGVDQFGNEISDVTFTWTGLGPQGSIDQTGRFTAGTEAGTYDRLVKVTAAGDEASRSVLIGVTITPGPLSSVALEPTAVTLDIGATQPFTLTARDSFENEITDVVASWSVVPDVGAIDPDRVLTIGTVAGAFPSAVRVEVVHGEDRLTAIGDASIRPDPLAVLSVTPGDTVLERGSPQQYTAVGLDRFGNEISDLALLWEADGGRCSADLYRWSTGCPGRGTGCSTDHYE